MLACRLVAFLGVTSGLSVVITEHLAVSEAF
jgi:hypothetical protein